MTTFAIPVDGPDLQLFGREFLGTVRIVGQPTYGRVLFAQPPGATIHDCSFTGFTTTEQALIIERCHGVRISHCAFMGSR